MSKSFSHAPLYNFCHELYCKNIDTLSGIDIHPAIANSPVNKLFYWYPATSNALLNIYPDINTLTQKGWIPGFVNTPFIIWYRKDQTIQCIPVDLTSAQMVRTGSLNTDLPFSYRWVRVVTGNKSHSNNPVYVCSDPVIAALLIDRGILTVAMGGDFLPHAHEKHLVALNKPLIYLGTTDKKDAAAKFVRTLHRYNCEVDVALVENLHDLLTLDNEKMKSDIQTARAGGAEFLINRIANKRRTSSGISANEEYSQLLSEAPHDVQMRYQELMNTMSHKPDTVNYANACTLFAELLRANMHYLDAQSVVKERYGLCVNVNEKA
tara:strand:- start:23572 stop:24537 length:966 start_codon:yes stop_codon:yes gene_type:complete